MDSKGEIYLYIARSGSNYEKKGRKMERMDKKNMPTWERWIEEQETCDIETTNLSHINLSISLSLSHTHIHTRVLSLTLSLSLFLSLSFSLPPSLSLSLLFNQPSV